MENWTILDDKALELALLIFPEALTNRLEKIADMFPGQSLELVRRRYHEKVRHMSETNMGPQTLTTSHKATEEPPQSGQAMINTGFWTEEEHRQFLEGLEKCGKGNWMTISKNFVVTRTHTQIASHAQKYFKSLEDANKENNNKRKRERGSIYTTTHTHSKNSQSSQDHQFWQQAVPSSHLILPANESQHNPQNARNHLQFGSGYPNYDYPNLCHQSQANLQNHPSLGFEYPNLSSTPQDQNFYQQYVPASPVHHHSQSHHHQNSWNGQSLGSESIIASLSHTMPHGQSYNQQNLPLSSSLLSAYPFAMDPK